MKQHVVLLAMPEHGCQVDLVKALLSLSSNVQASARSAMTLCRQVLQGWGPQHLSWTTLGALSDRLCHEHLLHSHQFPAPCGLQCWKLCGPWLQGLVEA